MWAKYKQQPGFTIVELLIVIVVIAILAAISIVAYNGIQARANTSSALSAANTTLKKAESFNTVNGYYPTLFTSLYSAASTETYSLTGVGSSASLTNSTKSNVIRFQTCGSGSPAALGDVTSANVTGVKVLYRDYTNSTVIELKAGTISGTGINCHDNPTTSAT